MRTLLVCCALGVATSASATTLLFDFGNSNLQSPSLPNVPTWNNVIYANPDPPPPLFAVFDSTGGIAAGVGLEVTDQFFINGPPSTVGSENPSGDAAAYPVEATDDFFFGSNAPFAGEGANPYAEFKLTGLDGSSVYDLTFFASRQPVGDNRETEYIVTGAVTESTLLNPSNNDSEVARVLSMSPDANGEITVGVQSGPNSTSNFYYINVLQVDISAIPEPSTVAMLALAGVGFVARRRR